MSLLIVDDEDDIRSMVADFLREEGYEVAEAANSAEAKRLLGSGHPANLMITDVRMPGESGIELARYVRENYPKVTVLFASGNVTDAELAGEPFIMKPFPLSRLACRIRGLLADRS